VITLKLNLNDDIKQIITISKWIDTLNVYIMSTRTAWAVFKYCGTKPVTLRMKKKILED
jgi:hypothetical protein